VSKKKEEEKKPTKCECSQGCDLKGGKGSVNRRQRLGNGKSDARGTASWGEVT